MRPANNKGLTEREKAERDLEDALMVSLPDPYDYHSVKVSSEFKDDCFHYSASVTFLMPSGVDRTYTSSVYGLDTSDMKGFAIRSIQKLFQDQRQYPACD